MNSENTPDQNSSDMNSSDMNSSDMNSSDMNSSDMNADIPAQEHRITEAFTDLARRANAVDVDHGPHVAGARVGAGGSGGRSLIPALAFAVIAAVIGFGGWQLLNDDGAETNIATDDVEDDKETDDGATEGDGNGSQSIGTITEVTGVPDMPFLLIETDGTVRAGYPSDGESWIDLPSETLDALPDGDGGLFYTTTSAVVHLTGSGATPVEVGVLEEVDADVDQDRVPQLIATRMIDGRPAVLALINNSLTAYFSDGSTLARQLDDFDGTVEEIAVDRMTLAAIVSVDDLRAVMTASLAEERPVWNAIPAVPSDAQDAPRNIALAGDRLVVGTSDEALTYNLPLDDDQAIPLERFPLPASPLDGEWWSFDASGTTDNTGEVPNLIIGFGESALTINLDDGERAVIGTNNNIVDGWVRSAHWAFDPRLTGGGPVDPADPTDVRMGYRYRVNRAIVAADSSDPFLNMRMGPGSENILVAKLPPAYTGIVATGEQALTDDGALWIEVELTQPLQVLNGGSDNPDERPTGWVNQAFVEYLPGGVAVGLDDVPACTGGEFGRLGGGLSGEAHVYALESTYLSENCLRVVITIGEGPPAFNWQDVRADIGPAAALPTITNPSSGGYGSVVDLGNTTSIWPENTETDDGVYISRGVNGNLQLMVPLRIDGMDITPLPELGIVVVDMNVVGPAAGGDDRVVLTGAPLVGDGSIAMIGIARPFEATLGLSIVDANDAPVTAVYSGSSFLGTVESDQYAVSTTDWLAWGQFAVKAAGLAPGDYTLLVDGFGAIENPLLTRIPFTIETAGEPVSAPDETERIAAARLVSFAQGGSIDNLPLADEVTLSLALEEQIVHTREELAERDNWLFTASDGFGGFSGPFSVLETLNSASAHHVEFTTGPMPVCASPPQTWPSEWQGLSQVNIEPIGIDSCIQWFGVSLLLNADDEIEVITLDLFGP